MTEPPLATVSDLAATTAWSLLVVTVFLLAIINIAARGERGEHAGAAPDAVRVWRLHDELAEPDHAKPANPTTRQSRRRSTHGRSAHARGASGRSTHGRSAHARGTSGRGTSGYGAPGRAAAGHGRTGPAVSAAHAERTDTPRNRAASIAAASARASARASAADRHARVVPTSTPAQPVVDEAHRAACARYLAERRDRILAAEPPAYLGRHRLREPDNPSIDELTIHLPGIPLTVALSATHG